MHEFDQISKLAAEVLGKQPPSLTIPRLLAFLDSYIDCCSSTTPKGDKPSFQFDTIASAPLATRSTVTLGHTIAVHGVSIESFLPSICWSMLNALSQPVSSTDLVSWGGWIILLSFQTHKIWYFWSSPGPSSSPTPSSIRSLSLIYTTI